MSEFSLMQTRRVLITGASRGIGRAIAIRLASSGWQVAGHYARNVEAATEVEGQLGDASAGWYQADLGNRDEAANLVERVLADGPLDALVNNAGIYLKLDFAGSSESEFARVMSESMTVNFESPAILIRSACQHFLVQGHGKVLNVASRVGHRGEAGAAMYSASKAALINVTRALAVEHASKNIQHFAIAPGWVETAMAREGMDDRLPQILRDIPLGRMASPEDCAGAASFLLSDEANYLSGIVIDINGASYLR